MDKLVITKEQMFRISCCLQFEEEHDLFSYLYEYMDSEETPEEIITGWGDGLSSGVMCMFYEIVEFNKRQNAEEK